MTLADITARLRAAETRAGRAAGSVTLIAISKLQPVERVTAVLDQGQRVFGENYVQEAQGKWPGWRRAYPGVALHMVGPLQSNKARVAVGMFDAIHTLDRMSLARRLAALAGDGLALPQLFVQVNTGDEPQKAGVLVDELPGFLRACAELHLAPEGLMCIPPEAEDPVPHFRLLARLARDADLPLLSMGMSGDFEAAVACGATHIRVGSAIFGDRPNPRA